MSVPEQLLRHFENADDLWIAWCERSQPPAFRTRNGISIHHQPCDPVYFLVAEIFFRESYTGGFFTPRLGQTVVDCGANIGVFALFLSDVAPGIKVHCFEPSADTFRRLKSNIDLNDLQQFVSAYPYAIWKENTQRALHHFLSSGRRSFFGDGRLKSSGPNEMVKCVDLCEAIRLCEAERIDLLKIDVEGAELEIVEAAPQSVWQSVEKVVLEYHEEMRPGCRERILRALSNAGYRQLRVRHTGNVETSPVGIIQASR